MLHVVAVAWPWDWHWHFRPDNFFGSRTHQVSRPFSSPWLVFIDTVRVSDILVWALLAARVAVAVWNKWTKRLWRSALWVGIVCNGWYTVEGEFDHIGTGIGRGGRLYFGTVGLYVCMVVAYRVLRPEPPYVDL